MRHVPVMDASGLHAFEVAVEKMMRDGVRVLLTAVQPQPMKVMHAAGLIDRIGIAHICANIDEALGIAASISQQPRRSGLRRASVPPE
jgi:SulP family sulfate permease